MILSLLNKKFSQFTISDLVVWSLYLYIFSLVYLSGMTIGNLISKAIGVLFILFFIIFEVIINKRKLVLFNEMICIAIWFIFCLLSGILAKDNSLYLDRLATITQLIIFYIFGCTVIIQHKVDIDKILLIIIFATVLIFVQGLLYSGGNPMLMQDTRLYSSQGNPNTIANFGAYTLIFTSFFLLKNKRILSRIIFLLIFLFIIHGLLKTESRKGIIAIPVIICLFFILNSIENYKKVSKKMLYIIKIVLIVIGLIIALYAAYQIFTHSVYFKRFQNLLFFVQIQSGKNEQALKTVIDYSTYERRQFIKYGIQMWLDHFWIGTGLDNFKATINEYWLVSKHFYAHNNYVELLSTTGLLGFLSYYMLYFIIFRRLYLLMKEKELSREDSFLIQSLIVALIILTMIEMVIVSYYLKFIWLILMLMSSYSQLLYVKYNKNDLVQI